MELLIQQKMTKLASLLKDYYKLIEYGGDRSQNLSDQKKIYNWLEENNVDDTYFDKYLNNLFN
jgi:hypothetical protein